MKMFIATAAGILLGSLVTFWSVQKVTEKPDPNLPKGSMPSPAQVTKLEKEVDRLKNLLAKADNPKTPENGAPADAVVSTPVPKQPPADALEAKKKALLERSDKEIVKKMEALKEKFNFTPEQLQAVEAWHRVQAEAFVQSRMKDQPDPADYHLNLAYRQDLPPAVQVTLPPDQKAVWDKHDLDARADYAENWTSGEMGYMTETFALSREQKDALFPKLSALYLEDTAADFLNVRDLESLSQQKDSDNARRREFYSQIFTPKQLEKWETLAAEYKDNMMKRYGAK